MYVFDKQRLELKSYFQILISSFFFCIKSVYFDRDDVALNGLSRFFKHLSERENSNADKLIEYQNLRGGRVVLTTVGQPAKQEFESALAAMEFVLAMAKRLNQVNNLLIKSTDLNTINEIFFNWIG